MSDFATAHLQALVLPLLGTPYGDMDCWELVRHLYRKGLDLDLERDTETASGAFMEVWYRGEPVYEAIQPWDLLVLTMHEALPVSSHVAIALDSVSLVHARAFSTGVAVEPIRRWRSKLLQIARPRRCL